MIEKANELSYCAEKADFELGALCDLLYLIGEVMERESKVIYRCSLYLSQIYILENGIERIREELSKAINEFNQAKRQG